MAQDHFETPPDPKQIHERSQMTQNRFEEVQGFNSNLQTLGATLIVDLLGQLQHIFLIFRNARSSHLATLMICCQQLSGHISKS